MDSGNYLSSRAVSSQVLSGFGMLSYSCEVSLRGPTAAGPELNTKEKRHSFEYRFIGFRQLPILPGRFQPSTFSVWRLNFCVRYGNRWNPPAIVTGNCYSILFPSATSKPHRTDLKSSNNYFFQPAPSASLSLTSGSGSQIKPSTY